MSLMNNNNNNNNKKKKKKEKTKLERTINIKYHMSLTVILIKKAKLFAIQYIKYV